MKTGRVGTRIRPWDRDEWMNNQMVLQIKTARLMISSWNWTGLYVRDKEQKCWEKKMRREWVSTWGEKDLCHVTFGISQLSASTCTYLPFEGQEGPLKSVPVPGGIQQTRETNTLIIADKLSFKKQQWRRATNFHLIAMESRSLINSLNSYLRNS